MKRIVLFSIIAGIIFSGCAQKSNSVSARVNGTKKITPLKSSPQDIVEVKDEMRSGLENLSKKHRNRSYSKDPLTHYVDEVVDQLLASSSLKQRRLYNVAVMSFVNLHNFQQTSNFGRLLSETLLTRLAKRGVKVVDFRGQKIITLKKKQGEFFLSREASRLKSKFYNNFVAVGTYAIYGDRLVLNVRIMNNKTGEVVAAAESIITDPDIVTEICENGLCQKRRKKNVINVIEIKQDPCDDMQPCE